MAPRSYRMIPALAAFVAVSLAGGGLLGSSDRLVATTAHAQSDPASRTLRFAPGDVVRATHSVDAATRTPVVEVRLSRDAAVRLRDFTTAHVGRRADFKVEGRVISSPVIQAPIAGGSFIITGGFTVDEARAMVAAIGAANTTLEISLAD